MTAARQIPPDLLKTQLDAADPEASVFVSANAGSGKTHVLAQRVINLLLDGVDPAKILCITFTKAAAANMANRVFGTLACWTALADDKLDAEIAAHRGRQSGGAQRTQARRLFASALETPGGLKVQTIHAFCTRLLHQFPFEADVAARFTVLDDASTSQLFEQLTLAVLLEASAAPESELGRALETAIVAAPDVTFKEAINEAISKRDALRRWIERAGTVDKAVEALSRNLSIEPNDSEEAICRACEREGIPVQEWKTLCEIFARGKKFDQYQSERWRRAAAAGWPAAIDDYLLLFLREEDGTPKEDAYLMGKELRSHHPELWTRLDTERTRLAPCLNRLRAIRARDRTRSLVTIAEAVTTRYQAEKERRALLDYDDLIDKTLALFVRSSAAWVRYKLDLGIDHVLIDEAQDTSPKQWKIIKTIASEFTPGGARANTRRTIFAVGDEKQSIFSFQGAAPAAFDEMRRYFAAQFEGTEQEWRYLRFHYSFRSGANVLGSVDRVFRDKEIYLSVTADQGGIPPHDALPDAAPGLVEIWPLTEPDKKAGNIEGWDAPFDTESEISPRVVLARRIAANVRLWLSRGARAKDVLVLVRQRGPLFEAIIRALKQAHIDVAGADRLALAEHIAVMDLIALGDALLLPDDDLALASVLRSPLFSLSDEQLFALAWNRNGSLRNSLRAKTKDKLFGEASQALDELSDKARELSPFAFYAHVLGARSGRARILSRLGPEANDALDEFLNLALDYEARETPSLQGFLNWLRAAKSEVKRDMEMERDEVRVMTVHGAKGLEAPIVVLADTTTAPAGPRDPKLLVFGGDLVWAGKMADDFGPVSDAREALRLAARDEYRRLLYVAMTRAAERLIVCGTKSDRKIPDGCWYQLVREALENESECTTEPADDGKGEVLRYRKQPEKPKPASPEKEKTAQSEPLPAWLRNFAKADPEPILVIKPSEAVEDDFHARTSTEPRLALLRGTLVHRLMQSLPDIPAEHRASAIDAFLERAARANPDLSTADRQQIAKSVLKVLGDERFHDLFAPGSRAEVPIVGTLTINGKTVEVSGQVDRLAVTPASILIGDFKTNRPASKRIEDVPKNYLGQLACYRTVLQKLYPGRKMRAALIWTEVPDLMELSAEALDRALAQVTSA